MALKPVMPILFLYEYIKLTLRLTMVWHLCQINQHSACNKDISSWFVTFDIFWFLIFVILSCKVLILCGWPCHQDEWIAGGAIFKCCMNLSFYFPPDYALHLCPVYAKISAHFCVLLCLKLYRFYLFPSKLFKWRCDNFMITQVKQPWRIWVTRTLESKSKSWYNHHITKHNKTKRITWNVLNPMFTFWSINHRIYSHI